MQLFSANATMFFFKILIFFCPQKVEKTTLKSCSEKLKSTFFSLLPAQPKWPKQKNSCSKMWPIEQLYIELGFDTQWSILKNMGAWNYELTPLKTTSQKFPPLLGVSFAVHFCTLFLASECECSVEKCPNST